MTDKSKGRSITRKQKKHDTLIDIIASEYNDAFDVIEKNREYKHWNGKEIINGEIDLLMYNKKYDCLFLYEIKGSGCYRQKAKKQLNKAERLFVPDSEYSNVAKVYKFYANCWNKKNKDCLAYKIERIK